MRAAPPAEASVRRIERSGASTKLMDSAPPWGSAAP